MLILDNHLACALPFNTTTCVGWISAAHPPNRAPKLRKRCAYPPYILAYEELAYNARPTHQVRLSAFRLAETPVTNHQYALFLEAGDHREPRYWRDRRYSDPEQPVVGVSWHDATAYCAWLAKLSGLPITLPSEAQWKYAARGDEGRTYPWGEQQPNHQLACFDQDPDKGRPDPVGSHPKGRGPFGTLDQAGNIWEWCLDTWNDNAYATRQAASPQDPIVINRAVENRVLRGGGWYYTAGGLRAAYRRWHPSNERNDVVGFRVAVAPASL